MRIPSPRSALLLLLALAAPPAAPAADPPSVAGVLRPYVKTLSRPLYTWTYNPRQKLGLAADGAVEPSDPALGRYLQSRFARFWDLRLEPHPYAMASGLYVAADPVASRAFGGVGDDHWSLAQIVLDRGFRFVDVRTHGDERDHALRFSPEVEAALAAAGCDAKLPGMLLTMLESRACREIAVRTLADLDVDGILYDFRSAPLAGCGSRPSGAFILVRAEAVDLTRAKVFTAQPPTDGAAVEDRLRIRDLFARARQAGSLRPPPWPELDGVPPPAGMETWMRDSLLGCGDHAEDALPDPRGADLAGLAEAARQAPDSARAHYELGAALVREGKLAEGEEQLAEAARIDPDDAQTLADLALLKATAADPAVRNSLEAVWLAERLVGMTQYRQRFTWPKIVKLRASMVLATAYLSAGRLERARDYAEHALELAVHQRTESDTPLTLRREVEARALLAQVKGGGQAASPVAAALQLRLRVLSRPVYTFHYAPRARIGLPPSGYAAPDDPLLPAFLRGKVERYWDLSQPTAAGAAASGLWAGIDPVAGRHFGGVGDGWALAQITLPAGFRFLEVREGSAGHPDPGFPPEARRALAEAGCAVGHPAALLMQAESPACRHIAVRVLRELGVEGLLGSFPCTRFATCGQRSEGVFVLLDPASVAPDRVRLLTRDLRTGDAAADDRLRIQDLFARAREVGSERPLPWPELAAAPPPAGMEAWMREHLLGCGDWAEDGLFTAPSAVAEKRP